MVVVLTFSIVLGLSFATIALLTRESQWEKKVRHRVRSLTTTGQPGNSVEPEASKLLKDKQQGMFPWFDQYLDRYNFAVGLKRLAMQAGSQWTLGTFALYSLGAGVFCLLTGYYFFPILALDGVLAAVGLSAPYLYLKYQRSRRTLAFNDGLADAIDLMARALRAGHSLSSAIEVLSEQAAGPVAQEFQAVFQQQNFGLPMRDALLAMAERVPSKDLRFLVTAMLVQKETGGNLTEILDRTSYVIRERIRIEGEVRTHTAQGRLTGWILSLLPIALLVMLNLINPGYSAVLLHDPTGQKLLYAGAALIAIGSFIISKIVDVQV